MAGSNLKEIDRLLIEIDCFYHKQASEEFWNKLRPAERARLEQRMSKLDKIFDKILDGHDLA